MVERPRKTFADPPSDQRKDHHIYGIGGVEPAVPLIFSLSHRAGAGRHGSRGQGGRRSGAGENASPEAGKCHPARGKILHKMGGLHCNLRGHEPGLPLRCGHLPGGRPLELGGPSGLSGRALRRRLLPLQGRGHDPGSGKIKERRDHHGSADQGHEILQVLP